MMTTAVPEVTFLTAFTSPEIFDVSGSTTSEPAGTIEMIVVEPSTLLTSDALRLLSMVPFRHDLDLKGTHLGRLGHIILDGRFRREELSP